MTPVYFPVEIRENRFERYEPIHKVLHKKRKRA